MMQLFATRLLGLACLSVAVLVVARAVMDPLLCHDSWDYHLPFAAWLWDINDAQNPKHDILRHFKMRFQGFGLIAEWWQGFFWWVTGSLNSTPLVNIIPLYLAIFLSWRWFKVPVPYALFTALAMPLIALHAMNAYIDLFIASLQAIMILACMRVLILVRDLQTPTDKKKLRIASAVLAVSAVMVANAKYTAFGPVVVIVAMTFFKVWNSKRALIGAGVLGAGFVALLVMMKRTDIALDDRFIAILGYAGMSFVVTVISLFNARSAHKRLLWLLVLVTLASGAILARNAVQFHNPFYPLKNPYYDYGFTFFQNEKVHLRGEASHYFEYKVWEGVRDFFLSLAEYNILMHPPRGFFYEQMGSPGGFSGGLYGPLVCGLVAYLLISYAWCRWKKQTIPGLRDGLHFLLALTVLFAFTIQSFQLRYCFVWPLMLITLTGMLLQRQTRERPWTQLGVQGAMLGVLVACQTMLPLQRTLYDLKWVSYYPEGVLAKLDKRAIDDFYTYGTACRKLTPPPYPDEGFNKGCYKSYVAYSPVFTGTLPEANSIYFTDDKELCRKIIEGEPFKINH